MSNPVTIVAPAGIPVIDITRDFDFPVEEVWRAHADPELFVQWLGPSGYEMELPEFDMTTGGHYRFVHRDGRGGEFGFYGVFHLVREHELVIRTFEFEGVPDVVSLEFGRFEDLGGGRSRVSGRSVFPTVEARDGMVASGMERGVVDGFEKLDALLARTTA